MSPSTNFATTGPPSAPCPTSSAAWAPAATPSWSTASTIPPCFPSSPARCWTPSVATAPTPAPSNCPAATTPSNSPPSPTSPATACSPSSSNPSPSGTGFSLRVFHAPFRALHFEDTLSGVAPHSLSPYVYIREISAQKFLYSLDMETGFLPIFLGFFPQRIQQFSRGHMGISPDSSIGNSPACLT